MRKLNRLQAVGFLLLTIAILFLLACLFSTSFISWNTFSMCFFYILTAILVFWTFDYYFFDPQNKLHNNNKTLDFITSIIKEITKPIIQKKTIITETQIGTQIWAAENLIVKHFRNGDPIPEVKTEEEWKRKADLGEPAFCYYNNDPENEHKYGILYNYFAVEDERTLAPSGWKVPSYNDWMELQNFVKKNTTGLGVGEALKSSRQVNTFLGSEYNTLLHPRWEENQNNIGADLYCFGALPGGYRSADGDSFEDIGLKGVWWTTTDDIYDDFDFCKTVAILSYFTSDLHFDSYSKCTGISVRCIKDEIYPI